MPRGYTFLELLALISVLALSATAVAPAARVQRDKLSVRSARDVVSGVLARGRQAAVELGGAVVWIRDDPPRAWIEAGEWRTQDQPLGARVTVRLPGDRSYSTVRFSSLGIGVVASQTLSFHRGEASLELVISSFGRIVRR